MILSFFAEKAWNEELSIYLFGYDGSYSTYTQWRNFFIISLKISLFGVSFEQLYFKNSLSAFFSEKLNYETPHMTIYGIKFNRKWTSNEAPGAGSEPEVNRKWTWSVRKRFTSALQFFIKEKSFIFDTRWHILFILLLSNTSMSMPRSSFWVMAALGTLVNFSKNHKKTNIPHCETQCTADVPRSFQNYSVRKKVGQ